MNKSEEIRQLTLSTLAKREEEHKITYSFDNRYRLILTDIERNAKNGIFYLKSFLDEDIKLKLIEEGFVVVLLNNNNYRIEWVGNK